MRTIRILLILLALVSPCLAEEKEPLRNVVSVADHVFSIPTYAFFAQLQKQFCGKREFFRCKSNSIELFSRWTYFQTYLEHVKIRENTGMFSMIKEAVDMVRIYDLLNAKVDRFVETGGMDIKVPED